MSEFMKAMESRTVFEKIKPSWAKLSVGGLSLFFSLASFFEKTNAEMKIDKTKRKVTSFCVDTDDSSLGTFLLANPALFLPLFLFFSSSSRGILVRTLDDCFFSKWALKVGKLLKF